MSRCPAPEELERFADGLLSEEDAAWMEAHLHACVTCAKRRADVRSADERVLGDLRELTPADLADIVREDSAVPLSFSVDAGAPAGPLALPGYSVVRELHRGGQGIVFQAIQEHTNRKVAIKVLLEGGHASHSAKRRFEREIELAAQLKHPNIVSVFHSGMTPDGRQYCVMDYVSGLRLDQHVREKGLTLEGVLQLVATICDAVMYAHQRGIIHRDLKPSNIVIDGQGEPRVLDFGLAKQMVGGAASLASMTGQVIGTLPYMAPEQTGGNPEEVDTRSDIYALGVILYQLLTGHYPYPVEGQVAEVMRHIAETQPTPPSRRWSHDSGVRRRGATDTDMPDTCPIDDEVQTIALKALAKEKERRYQSAAELARDIRHYLAGEPIEAKRDSTWYVFKKTLRRHKVPAALIGLVVLLIVGSSIALSVMVGRQARLLQEVAAERDKAVRAEEDAVRARERADFRFSQVRTLANKFIFDFHGMIDDLKGATKAREYLVKTALEYLNSLAEEADDPDLIRELAVAYSRVADVQGNPHAANLGDTAGALQSYRRSESLLVTLIELKPDDPAPRLDITHIRDDIAVLLAQLGETEEARSLLQQNLATLEELTSLPDPPPGALRSLSIALDSLADFDHVTGRSADALKHQKRSLSIRETQHRANPEDRGIRSDLAVACQLMGELLDSVGRTEEGLAHLQRCMALREQIVQESPDDQYASRRLALGCDRLASALSSLDRQEEADALYERSLRIREELARVDPSNFASQRDLAISHNEMGRVMDRRGDPDRSLQHFRSAVETYSRLLEQDPQNLRLRTSQVTSYLDLSLAHRKNGRSDEAMVALHAAVRIAEDYLAEHKRHLYTVHTLHQCYELLGAAHVEEKRFELAEPALIRALELAVELSNLDREHPMAGVAVADSHSALGKCYQQMERAVEAEAAFRAALEVAHDLDSRFGRVPNIKLLLRDSCVLLARWLVERPETDRSGRLGQLREAVDLLREAEGACVAVKERYPDVDDGLSERIAECEAQINALDVE